ncbi:MAG: alginate lyase family protein [Acidobacteriota bacterium]
MTEDQWITRRQAKAALFADLPDARIGDWRRSPSPQVRDTLDAATRILRHEFNLLGSGPYTPADPDRSADGSGYQPIDWYLDPVSGLRFPRGIPLAQWSLELMRPGRADIKLPWELARCQHWPLLGQAYRLTGDDRFAVEVEHELHDFMAANPIGIGVNWTCTMDVALRAANWAIALDLIRSCASLTVGFWRAAHEALFDHGVFIEGHLENHYEVTSNHFLSNVVGLFYLAAVFDDLPRGAAWDRQCRGWLAQEVEVQVLPDGADFESSVPYHRLVTELFLGAARLAEYRGRPLPPALIGRVETMVDFLANVLRPDGLMPQVGDADDGRLHILSGYGSRPPQDPRHLFGPAACFFRSDRWARLVDEGAAWEAEWWGYDSPGIDAQGPDEPDTLRHFPHAGLTVVRHARRYLLITNGVVGTRGFGNHKHNDLLGFEYHAHGGPVFVDPGSHVYTSDPDSRNRFRSTRSHNTICVDEEEQNECRPDWLFRMFEKAFPEHLEVVEGDEWVGYRGRHRGYTRLPQPVVHERTFRLERTTGGLSIVDVLEGQGSHRLRWHFHFAPGVTPAIVDAGAVEIRAAGGVLLMTFPQGLRPTISPAEYSPSYGVRVPCMAIDLDAVERIDGRREYVFQVVS